MTKKTGAEKSVTSKKETKKQRRDRILVRLQALGEAPSDPESDHDEADKLLLELIDDPVIEAAFNNIGKWYS